MFKKRLITCLLLIPIVLFIVYMANDWVLSVAILLLYLALGWEWLALIPINELVYKIIAMLMLLGVFLLGLHHLDSALYLNIVVWTLIILAILCYPKGQAVWGNSVVVAIFSTFVLTTFLCSLYVFVLEDKMSDELIYLLLLVWAVDIGAYLFGKKLGKHKLIPNVSPGKTIEGTLGGIILALLVAALGHTFFEPTSSINWFIHASIVIVLAIFGDLFISMLKRRSHVKDTGNILPGHGGVLDRLDSLIAALPIFYFLQEFCL